MRTIKLSDTESDALLSILDLAVKAAGLQVAGNALFFANKINAAANVAEKGEHHAEGKKDGNGTAEGSPSP